MRIRLAHLIASASLISIFGAAPAATQVLGATNVNVTSATTFTVGGQTFTFDFDPVAAAAFNPATFSVQTGGTAQTSAFGGFLGIPLEPSLFFTSSNIFIDGNLFPSFAAFPELTPIPFSLTPGDLALRTTVGADSFFGFARLNGDGTLNFAFESQPNVGITAGAAITGPLAAAVPEPGTWAMMLLGFGAIGLAMRRSRRATVRLAAA